MKRVMTWMLSVLLLNAASAQKNAEIFAITDETPDGKAWVSLRILQSARNQTRLLATNSNFKTNLSASNANAIQKALCSGSAAVGYDEKSNRVFYITAIKGDLRYCEIKTGNTIYGATNIYTTVVPDLEINNGPENQGDIFTRMTMGADGFMYALTNNGRLFIRFNPDKPEKLENLGAVHGFETSAEAAGEQTWGGDMISDSKGNLIVFSAKGHVFTINTTSRQANLIGKLQNMPEQFVISGAAVQEDGSILLSSTGGPVKSAVLYSIDVLKLSDGANTSILFNSGDLASSYFYKTTGQQVIPNTNTAKGSFAVSPNPVLNGRFQISLSDGLPEGNYQIELVNMSGARVFGNTQTLSGGKLSNALQTQNIPAGMYLVKLYHTQQKIAHTQKVVFQ